MTVAPNRIVRMIAARAALSDLEGLPVRAPGELWHAARAELVLLVAELENPTAAGLAERREVALNLAADMGRFVDQVEGVSR